MPYAILSDVCSCRRVGFITAVVDRIDGVQWVALSASAKSNVLGWLPGYASATDFTRDGAVNFLCPALVLQLLSDACRAAAELELDRNVPVRLTGHSIGGSVAILLAMKLSRAGFSINQVVTFGSPKFTRQDGADALQALPLRRVTLDEDPVPAFPPLDTYKHAGSELQLPSDIPQLITGSSILPRLLNLKRSHAAFWLLVGNFKVHSMENYLSWLPVSLIVDKYTLAALQAINQLETAAPSAEPIEYSFHWSLLLRENSNPLFLSLCNILQICEVSLVTEIIVTQWKEAQVSMRGIAPIKPSWELGLVTINEAELGLALDAQRSGSTISMCAAFSATFRGYSDLFGMLKDPIQGLAVACDMDCNGFSLTVSIQTWAQPFGISWLEFLNLLFRYSQTQSATYTFSGQVKLFNTTNTVNAVYGPATGMLGMSIGYPNPIPKLSALDMTLALCDCSLPSWVRQLLSVAEFRGVEAQFLRGSAEPVPVNDVTLQPGIVLRVQFFSLFWGLLNGSAKATVDLGPSRGWALAVTIPQAWWFNVLDLQSLQLDVKMTNTSSYLQFSAKGTIKIKDRAAVTIERFAINVVGDSIKWDVVLCLGGVSLSKMWSTKLIRPNDLTFEYSIDLDKAQTEVTSQAAQWLEDKVTALKTMANDLWNDITQMIVDVAKDFHLPVDALRAFLGLGRKFQIQSACSSPDLSSSRNGPAALATALDAALGCGVLQGRAYLQQVFHRVPLDSSQPVLRCLAALPPGAIPPQLTSSLSGAVNVSTMSDSAVSQLIQFALWHWPESSTPEALQCLVANMTNAALWDTVDAVLSAWPRGNNASGGNLQEEFLSHMEQNGLDPANQTRALQAFQVLLLLGDCGGNQTARDYQRCVEGDSLACPLYYLGTWRMRQCASTKEVANDVLQELAPGIQNASAGKLRAMQQQGVVEWMCFIFESCRKLVESIQSAIDHMHVVEDLHDNLVDKKFPTMRLSSIGVSGNVSFMAAAASIALTVSGTFNDQKIERTIQVDPTSTLSKWMAMLWDAVADILYQTMLASKASTKWQATAAGGQALCQGNALLRPPSLQPGSPEAELWAYWTATRGAAGRDAVTAPTTDQIFAGYQSPAFVNNSWRFCDPICGNCDDIGYRTVDPATNATVFRTQVPDFVPPGYNGTPAPPEFAPVVFPANDTAFVDAPRIATPQASIPVYAIDHYIPACVEQLVPTAQCDSCAAVGWPRNCPPTTVAGVLGCEVDVLSQANATLTLRSLTPTALRDATINVSLWTSGGWQLLGSTPVFQAQAVAPFLFPRPLPLFPNETLRLRLTADQPGALLASPTYNIPTGTFAQAPVLLYAVDSWLDVAVQPQSPLQCHLSVEVCQPCSTPTPDSAAPDGGNGGNGPSGGGSPVVFAAAAAAAAAALVLG
eukprot:EG_transcript_474